MKSKLLRSIAAVLMLALVMVALLSMGALAEKEEVATFVPNVDLPDNDELYSMYVESLLYGDLYGDIMPFSTGMHTAGARLTGDDKKIYDVLVPYIKQIASGKRASTRIDVGKEVTFENSNYSHNDLMNSNVFDALYTDHPYEMYWSRSYVAGWEGTPTPNSIFVLFTPVVDYDASTDSRYPKVDTSKTSAASTAVENAKKVVADNAGKSDYAKLCAYKDYICNAVSYDDNANPNISMNSWELIHVFDGNPSTNVVCEGYAKAFQYLCDMTAWSSSEVQCYSVSGKMSGGTGAGPHMWNIVTLDGENYYLVDITNSDKESIGQNGGLFMAGVPGSVANGYTFEIEGTDVSFTYDAETVSVWENKVLTLASSNYNNDLKTLERIEVTGYKTEQEEGKPFDTTGMVVTAIYSNGGEKVTNYSVSPAGPLEAGATAVTVSYTENGVTKTATLAITVKAKPEPVVLTGIKVSTNPNKMTYTEGETFDATGMVVTAVYSDGSEKPATGYEFAPKAALNVGDIVTVSYGGYEVTVPITVNAKPVVLTGIKVTTNPNKMTYTEGETFDATGMVVTAVYSDGSEKPATGYEFSPKAALKVGDIVTVSYGGYDVTVPITVNAKPAELTEIKVATNPNKMTYTAGDMFDATGMVLTAIYSDGSTQEVTTGYTVNPSVALEAGATSVTVSYTVGGKTVSVELTGITVTAKPEEPAKPTTYTATVENGTGSGSYAEGASVSIAANEPQEGMRFAGWKGLEGLTITVGAAANTQLTFTMPGRNVTVSAVYVSATVPVTGITLNESQLDLTVGDTVNLVATVLPDGATNKNVTWSNSNPGVASFTEGVAARAVTSAREGVVTALAEGSTVITVKTEDGAFAATCKVSVAAKDTPVAPVETDAPVPPLTVDAGGAQTVSVRKGDTVEMSVVAAGGVAPYKYQWFISRNGAAFVAFEGATSATHTTTAVDEANNGYRYFCRVTDSNGQSYDSPIFTLDVVEKVNLPATGDHRHLGLWLALCVMSMAGMGILLRKTKRTQN